MRFLLDCDTLLALGHAGHSQHTQASAFIAAHTGSGRFLTTPISELAFVRIGTHAGFFSSIVHAQTVLAPSVSSASGRIAFLPDDLGAASLPAYVTRPRDTADGHLLSFSPATKARNPSPSTPASPARS